MKRLVLLAAIFTALSALTFIGCGNGTEEKSKQSSSGFEDGFYFNQDDQFDDHNWKNLVMLEVVDGKLTKVEFNSVPRSAESTKYQQSENGEYGMVENGGAQAPWSEQIDKAEKKFMGDPMTSDMDFDDEGKTDAISGVSITVEPFFSLAREVLEAGPTGRGKYDDGHYSAEAEEYHNGWKSTVDVLVKGGYIVAVYWDAVPEEGEKNKRQASIDGEYGMVANGDAQAPWFEQALKVESHVLENQGVSGLSTNDDGKTDAVSGVSITVSGFKTLAQEALEKAQ